jgi:hypothetical protein
MPKQLWKGRAPNALVWFIDGIEKMNGRVVWALVRCVCVACRCRLSLLTPYLIR